MILPTSFAATLLGFAALLGATQGAPFRAPLPEPSVLARGSAMKNANLTPAQCKKQLLAHKSSVAFVANASGVATPVRLVGPLGGVNFLSGPKKSPYGIADCRLVLALLDAAPIFRAHGVKSVRVDNFYRRGARLPSGRKKSQHAYALAADITQITLDDGTVLDVDRDFAGRLGEPVCGPKATLHSRDPRSLALRNLACELGRSGIFHHILTPNHDRAHKNHFHLDIARDNRWFSID